MFFSIVLDLLGFVCGMFMSFRCSASANEVQTKTIIKTKHKMESQKHNIDPAVAKQTLQNFVFMAVFFYLFSRRCFCWFVVDILCLCWWISMFFVWRSGIHDHCNCFGVLSLAHIVFLGQWEHFQNSKTTRIYLILEHVFFAWATLFDFVKTWICRCLH